MDLCQSKTCAFILKSEAQNSITDDSHPHSVAVGDFNNDGLPDIVVANSNTNNIGVFLRFGDGAFANQMTYSTGSGSIPYAVAVADFNSDQRLDIAVANFGTNDIGIFLGTGNGNFTRKTDVSTASSRPIWVAVGDFNNDSHPDIAVANSGTNSIGVLLGGGNGSFAKQTTFSTGYDSLPFSLALGDFNHDSKLDIAVANSGTNNVGVLLGYGNGSFAIQMTFTTDNNSDPYSITVADLNNDTHLDIVVANSGTDNVGVLLGYGNGTFAMQTKYSTGENSSPRSVAVGDFDNDNQLDIAVANYKTLNVGLLVAYGNGTFADQTTYFTSYTSNPYTITTADFNNDSRLDIAVVNYDNNDVDILLTIRNANFSSQNTYATTGRNSNPVSIAFADFNKDSWLDIVVANYGADNIGVFLGYGNGSFASQTTYSTGSDSSPTSVTIGDFNNDNWFDIVVSNNYANNVGVFLGYSNGTFSSQTTYSTGTGSEPSSVAVGDFNKDGRLDIAVANSGTNNVCIFLGYGNGTFSSRRVYSTDNSSGSLSLAVADFNRDGRLDIAVANFRTNNVGVLFGFGNGTFSSQTIYSTGSASQPKSVVVGDFNNDTQLDIAVANYGTNTIGVLFGYDNGTFSRQTIYSTGSDSQPYSVVVGDFNNDSRLDIVVANYGPGNVGVFLGYGNGTFSSQTTYSTGNGSGPCAVASSDLNNDGWADITVANRDTSNVGVFIGFGNGSFSSQTVFIIRDASQPQSVAVGDFNNDSRLDIAIANYLGDNVDVFLGYGNGAFSPHTSYSTGSGSGPYSIAVGDFNNDNRLDIVVANSDTNNLGVFLGYGDGTFLSRTTYSTGRGDGPLSVAISDFNNDSRADIAVANSSSDNLDVLFGYGNGTFSSQASYSTGSNSGPYSVAVGDFNNDSRLDIVVANYESDNVGVFLGYGDGTFSNQTTYSTGSGSGPYSVAVGDLNNDGRPDIAIALLYSSAVGVLLGYDNGTFSSRTTYSTGSSSRPYSIAIGDWNHDNQLDMAVASCFTNNVGVFDGYGNGTFPDVRTYSTGINSCPMSVAFGDFNSDSLLDIVVTNSGANTIGVFLAFSYMHGVREGACSTGSSPSPRAVALGDFNNDAQLDITIANFGLNNVGVFLGYANGSYPIQTVFSTGVLSFPSSIAVGDFNNDSQLDITVANSGTENVGVLFGYGNGSFASPVTYSTGIGSIPQSVVGVDFNNDKKLDIAVANSGTDNVLVLLRYDSGAFEKQIVYSTGTDSNPWGVIVGDFNNDGWLDFAVANKGSSNVGVFLGFGNGTFSSQTTYSTGNDSSPKGMAVADFNNDSRLNIVVANYWGFNIGVFLGFGNGTFSSQTIYSTGSNSYPASVGIGDFNSDSRLDIAVSNTIGNVGVFLGYGNGTFARQKIYSTGSNSQTSSVVVGDFNNDGRLDIVVTNSGMDTIGVLFGYGNGSFSSQASYSTGIDSRPISLAVGDFNNDGQLDIVVTNLGMDTIVVLFGYGNGTFSSQASYSTGINSGPYSVVVGDFNNDRQLDIAIGNADNHNLGVLLGFANGTFFSQLTYSTGSSSLPYSVAVGDFNNDSRLDIIVGNYGTDNVGMFLGYISEDFLSAPSYSTGRSSWPASIAVRDFNNDTRLDIVVANNGTDNVMVLLGSGYGTFVSQTTYSTGNGSHPSWVDVGDFNNDSRLDIVVANPGTDNIGVLLGNVNGTFSSQTTYFTGLRSQPYSVAVVYFDNDTRLDIAVANNGTNSIGVLLGFGNGSFASQMIFPTGFGSDPYGIAVGDVNNDNLADIVATNNGYGNIDIISKTC